MTAGHFIFIPSILVIGIVIGWVLGSRAAHDAYAIVDTKMRRVELYRARYAVEDAQTKVMKAGLPDVLAQRLAVGR